MSGRTSANTENLGVFVTGGISYRSLLDELVSKTAAARSQATSNLGSAANSGGPILESLIDDVVINNNFVDAIRDALVDYSPGSIHVDVPASVADRAVRARGLANLAQLSPDGESDVADDLGLQLELEELQDQIEVAMAAGNYEAAAALRVQMDQLLVSQLDPETRSALAVGRHFEPIFGDDRFEGDLPEFFSDLDSDAERDIRFRLRQQGLSGPALDAAMDEITQAAAFYSDPNNSDALRRFDDSNDGNRDGDGIYTAVDAWLVVAHRTEGDPSTVGATIRQESLAGWVASSDLSNGELEQAYDGASRIGELTPAEQGFLVDVFVADMVTDSLADSGGADLNRNGRLNDLWHVRDGNFSPELEKRLVDATALQAINLEAQSGDAELPSLVSSVLATNAIEVLGYEASAEFIAGMDPANASLFAAAVNLDHTFPEIDPAHSIYQRSNTVARVVEEMLDQAGPGGTFNDAEAAFVFMTSTTAPHQAYDGEGHGPTPFGIAVPNALAVVANPGDAEAQQLHGDRLVEIFEASYARAYLASNGTAIDPATRGQLFETIVFGRHEYTDRYNEPVFWSAIDFLHNPDQIAVGLTIDVARSTHEAAYGTPMTTADEQALAEIVRTEQGQDLFGLNGDTNFGLRGRFVGMVLENGWTAGDFGDGDGWSNPQVNAEYLVQLARWEHGTALTQEQIDNLRAIGASEQGRRHLGLDRLLTDHDRSLLINLTLENGWDLDTFAEGPVDNSVINNAVARHNFAVFEPGTELADRLGELSDDQDPYGFVETALGLAPGERPDLVGPIVDQIYEHWEVDGINIVPVQLRTEGQTATLLLFEVHEADGTSHYVDLDGKSYSGPRDWWESNSLPAGSYRIPGEWGGSLSDSEFVAPASGNDSTLIGGPTKAVPNTIMERYGSPIITGVVIIGSVAVIIGSLGTAAPFVSPAAAATIGTVGAYTLGGVAAYEIYSGAAQLQDHVSHGGGYTDAMARDAYWSLGEGTMGLLGAGTYRLATRGTRLSNGLARTFTYANRGAEVAETGMNAVLAMQILESDLPPDEKRKQLALLGVMAALDFGVPVAANRVIGRNQQMPDGITWTQAEQAIASGAVTPHEIIEFTTARNAGVLLGPDAIVAATRGGLDAPQIIAIDQHLSPSGREAFGRIATSDRVVGLDEWFVHTGNMATGSNPVEAADQVRRAQEEIFAVQTAMSDPRYNGTTFDLSADANAPIVTGRPLPTADIVVRDLNGEVVGNIEVFAPPRAITNSSELTKAINHTATKAASRADAGQPLEGTIESIIATDVDPGWFVDRHNSGKTQLDHFIDKLNQKHQFPDIDRITVVDKDTGVVEIQLEKRKGEWVNVFE